MKKALLFITLVAFAQYSLAYAEGVVPNAVLKKRDPKSGATIGLEPLPKAEWKHIQCKFYLTWEEQMQRDGGEGSEEEP
ncbi:hypothetical protein [Candidatus Igneacidithiobacillus taiwanensis]|uniref:hypothetical protein n=1 Tax=Candidatus Igneacidithiobacillus taiwanensis TaxID=1945924 RepID=UPI00289C44AE|nr:hypothetical protein [Candidatus Igneacidithiobacillus taiwanensis]MCE5360308.1 hypothetical protein [Acidithiobacillus sp.]